MKTLTIPRRVTRRVMLLSEFAELGAKLNRPLTEGEIDLLGSQPKKDAESIVIFLSELPRQEPPTSEDLERMWLEREQRVDGCVRQRAEQAFHINPHD